MSDHTADPLIGAVIGDYRIEGLFGAGAMGRVYRATRLRLGQQVALKVLEPYLANDVDFRTRFEREWRLAASLNHPNVVPIYDAGEVDGQLYLAMLPVDGGDLGQLIKGGPLAARRALAILGQVANALDAAHARGLVHRDVKPGNILLAAGLAGEGDEHVYLADFGLTKHAGSQSRLTRVGVFVGTYAYAAPEQFGSGAVGPPADIYALGCVLYECLTGHVPFETDSDAALMRAHLYEPLPSLRAYRPELPIALDIAIARATAKDPAMRYATARAFIADARAALAGGSIDNPARAVFDLPPTIVRPPADAPLAPPGSQPPPPSSTWGQPQTGWGQPPAPPGWGQPSPPPAHAYGPRYPTERNRGPLLAVGAVVLAALLLGGAVLALAAMQPPQVPPTSIAGSSRASVQPNSSPPVTPTPTPSRRPPASGAAAGASTPDVTPIATPTPTPTLAPGTPEPPPTANPWVFIGGLVPTEAELGLLRHIPPEIRLIGSEPACQRGEQELYASARAQVTCFPAAPEGAPVGSVVDWVDYALVANTDELTPLYSSFLDFYDIPRNDQTSCETKTSAESGYNDVDEIHVGQLACTKSGDSTAIFGWKHTGLLIYGEMSVSAASVQDAHDAAWMMWQDAGPID